jgi:hypothetical protein
MMRAVARSEGLQPVLDEIVEAAKRLCQGDHGQLHLADGDVFRIVAQSGDLEERTTMPPSVRTLVTVQPWSAGSH